MTVVDACPRCYRIARVQVERAIQGREFSPESLVAAVIQVDDRFLIADLGEAVDEGADEAKVVDASACFKGGGIRILQR